MGYQQWMETRYSAETNFSARRLMQRAFGSFDYEQAVLKTRALSLSDNYWLKRQDEDIRYKSVTPYLNKEWSEADEYTAGSLPTLFVAGKTDKRWLDAQTLLKVNSFKEVEPYALCAALALDNTAQAQVTDEGILLSNFTSLDIFYETMKQSGFSEDHNDPREIMVKDFKEVAVALFVIDYLIENTDRHQGNYGFLRCSKTGEYISMAPYHDFEWAWSGDVTALPNNAWQGYRGYIHDLCHQALSIADIFEYSSIIERRACELLSV